MPHNKQLRNQNSQRDFDKFFSDSTDNMHFDIKDKHTQKTNCKNYAGFIGNLSKCLNHRIRNKIISKKTVGELT